MHFLTVYSLRFTVYGLSGWFGAEVFYQAGDDFGCFISLG